MQIIAMIANWVKWLFNRSKPERLLCPSCGGRPSEVLDRRFLILSLARCSACGLLYRLPTDEPQNVEEYYQGEYADPTITEIPDAAELESLVADRFKSKFNRSEQVGLVRHILGEGSFKVLDYGCSWGYASWQFLHAGFEVEGFEIGRQRAEHARSWLGIPVFSDLSQLGGSYDLVFSCHVFEHVPQLKATLDKLVHVLKPGGYLLAITPNGSVEARNHDPAIWHKLWGNRHPIFLDHAYWFNYFKDWPKMSFSRHAFKGARSLPYDSISDAMMQQSSLLDMTGDELYLIARKPQNQVLAANLIGS